jgi:hypothetical protein
VRINSNVKSIKIASDHFAKHHYPFQTQYDFEEAIVLMDTAKNTFSVTYLESSSYDDEDDDSTFYQASDTEYFGLEKSTLISIVSFHVGLMLPKEKSRVVRQVAKEVIKSMGNEHAYTYVGWYGHSKDYSKYIIPIDKFISIVKLFVIPTNN